MHELIVGMFSDVFKSVFKIQVLDRQWGKASGARLRTQVLELVFHDMRAGIRGLGLVHSIFCLS